MSEDGETKAEKPLTMKGFDAIYRALDSKAAHTSFGNLPLSYEKTAPNFGFGTQNKNDGDKVFMGEEMARNINQGKHSPGPVYETHDKNKYNKAPGWGFGSDGKMKKIKPKYDFYENDRFYDDPVDADHNRKKKTLAPKFGTEPRFPVNAFEKVPGPGYDPQEQPHKKKEPKYTFGHRRTKGNQNALVNQTSTTKTVGPGRYAPESSVNTSNKKNNPRWTLSKAGRFATGIKGYDKHQTYDIKGAVGRQQNSKKKSAPSAHFGTAPRDISAKMGTFKDGMTGAMKVKMPHAKW
ncbi:unnamed protein product [Moneuplotes crassus]|uniref:Uncharacterized protein n=1 Tax=Euplotes crassus TaxID=5936 RepID=A0AAD1XRB7_EUPCR|nr:unnamed protein product [Moneuplotes crassus]